MEIDVDFTEIIKDFSENSVKDSIRRSIGVMAFECESSAKQIISENSVDTGQFLNSVWTETWEESDDFGFKMHDGVDYGVYHEFGTIKHWLPFFYYGDTSKPVLADWGRRVLGLTDEEMLAMGGLEVEINETSPFRRALFEVEGNAGKIFEKEFKK
jgi:hypothetical protein